MRVALVTARFRTRAPFDLGSQARSLAPALARAGASVEVFCGSGPEAGLPPFAQRRAEVVDHASADATFGVTTVSLPAMGPDAAPLDLELRLAEGFGAFLDRERPEVVHFERLDVFGTALVEEARSRGIRTVYCAADTWPAHDRASLLLPDMTPFELGDAEAEARALLVVAELGAGPLDLAATDAAGAARVRHLLAEPLTDPEDVARLRDASEAVEQRRAAKRVALSAVDRRFATTRLLAKNLSASVGRAFTFRAAGVDAALFRAPDAARAAAAEPRLVAMGDTSREGGIDLLLDALAAVAGEQLPLRPLLLLECSDPERDAEVARRVQDLDVETRWTRGPADVRGAVESADLIVITQRWGEVLPAACQVALAAGVPVVAARTPGVTEGLPPAAGQLFDAADASELADALRGLVGEEGSLGSLSEGAYAASRSVKSVDDEAREWLDTYGQLLAEVQGSSVIHGASSDVAARLEELHALSHAELFGLAQAGIGRLRQAFGLADSDAALLERAVARGGAARDRAMTASRDLEELDDSLVELRGVRRDMRLEEASRSSRIAGTLGDLARAEERLTEEVEAPIDVFDEVRLAIEAADEERTRLARTLDERDDLLRSIHRRIGGSDPARGAEFTSIKAFVTAAERDVAELRRHDEWMGTLGARLELALAGDTSLDPGATRTAEGLRAIAAELEWRRAELAAARAAGGASRARLLAGPLAGQAAAEDGGAETGWAPLPLDRATAGQPAAPPEVLAEERASFAEEDAEEDPEEDAEPASEAADDAVAAAPAAAEPPGPLPARKEETEVHP
ncbi:MAG: glycosyltransferase [Planctomycetota bacterium]|nr:glycosyltransferase [Planctomycetota bacterium]